MANNEIYTASLCKALIQFSIFYLKALHFLRKYGDFIYFIYLVTLLTFYSYTGPDECAIIYGDTQVSTVLMNTHEVRGAVKFYGISLINYTACSS